MPWSNQVTASGKQLYQGQPGTSWGQLFQSLATSANVTGTGATAIIKEITICNTTGTAANVSLAIGGTAAQNWVINQVSVNGNDTKVIGGLNLAVPASTFVYGYQSTTGAVTLTISGVEVQ